MSNIKNPKNPNPRGMITVALGELLIDVRKIAEQEERSTNRQLAIIIKEWIAQRKSNQNMPRGAA